MDFDKFSGILDRTLMHYFDGITKEEMIQTAFLAALGTVVSFSIYHFLRWLVNLFRKDDPPSSEN